jgi:arginyl-tRNA synthetase
MQEKMIFVIFAKALADLISEFQLESNFELKFEIPKIAEHGDLATNIAMQLAKAMKMPPRAIAEKIIEKLKYDSNVISKVEIAGAGFINIKFSEKIYSSILAEIIAKGDDFGRNKSGENKRVNVEYVSANPTGLLHLGHGRNACIGDTVANLFDWCGWDVTREYYFNNAGKQMDNLGKSIFARYKELSGDNTYPFPEDGYHGEYVRTIAQELIERHGDQYIEGTYQDLTEIRKYGESWCFEQIKQTLERMKINQDVYYNEDSLYTEGKIKDILDEFEKSGLSYKQDGAVWLKLSEMGLESDRVIVKSSGEPTYRLPDIAYHREKFRRGFDMLIDVFGADHIATVPDVMAGVKALGYNADHVKILIHQFVTLTENGVQVKMSKRTGKSYTLDELIEEVGDDVTRFFFIMRSPNTHLEFDLALAKEQSDKNPVFYLQYAHARIWAIINNAREKGIQFGKADLSLLTNLAEINLIKELSRFPEVVQVSCDKCEPHILCEYLKTLASKFHNFYHECRIIGVEQELMNARFVLADTTRIALNNGLKILGISRPEKM